LIRSLASIIAALHLVAPSFGPKMPAALLVHRLADDGDFDPFTLLAHVEHETRWQTDAIGTYDGIEYVGAGQQRLLNYPACQADLASLECEKVRASLLDWRFNLTETARSFVIWRAYCKDHGFTGEAKWWIQGLTGWDAKRHTTCGHRGRKALPVPEPVTKLLKRRAELAARF